MNPERKAATAMATVGVITTGFGLGEYLTNPASEANQLISAGIFTTGMVIAVLGLIRSLRIEEPEPQLQPRRSVK